MAGIDRRELLCGSAAVLAATLAPVAVRASAPAGVFLVDPGLAEAAEIARRVRAPGQSLIPLDDDPARLWRSRLAAEAGPIAGVTRWSDFVMLRELAHDQRLRVRSETHHPVEGGPLLVSWTLG